MYWSTATVAATTAAAAPTMVAAYTQASIFDIAGPLSDRWLIEGPFLFPGDRPFVFVPGSCAKIEYFVKVGANSQANRQWCI